MDFQVPQIDLNILIPLVGFIAGIVFGGVPIWFLARSSFAERLRVKDEQLQDIRVTLQRAEERSGKLQTENTEFTRRIAMLGTRLEDERKSSEEKLALMTNATEALTNQFQALSADALDKNSQTFLQLANTSLEKFQELAKGDLDARHKAVGDLVAPLKETLGKVDEKFQELEKNRISHYTSLTEQLKAVSTALPQLQKETVNLTRALRAPHVRGRWGEIQLKRVVEMAGMLEYCDFVQQETLTLESGRQLRPDMVVKLPSRKHIVVDSKAPLQAYLDSLETQDEERRKELLSDYARHIRTHLQQLGTKAYFDQFDSTPEFAVMFLPGETFFSAALEQDPGLIEYGVEQKVILSTPTTLIALLKAVAYGWRQEQLTENALEISKLGKELYERIRTMAGYFSELKRNLERSVESYNKAVASVETRVLPTARKFKELGAGLGAEIEVLEVIDKAPREAQALELTEILPDLPERESEREVF